MTGDHRHVLGMRVDAISYDGATRLVAGWARRGESRYVCVANVHMTMESRDSTLFRAVVNQADLVTPDGMPLVWALRLLGVRGQRRVYGPQLMLAVCTAAERDGLPVALYGGTEQSLQVLARGLTTRFPRLQLVCCIAPTFGLPQVAEDRAHTRQLAASGARIVFVGLGCPKQERWMAAHKGRIPAVMIGVGAAFDFLSGRIRQAPQWVQALGLEWLHRLCVEPRRLWRRYLKHNPRFLLYFAAQLVGKLVIGRRPMSAGER